VKTVENWWRYEMRFDGNWMGLKVEVWKKQVLGTRLERKKVEASISSLCND
jgi:hypothetical protein